MSAKTKKILLFVLYACLVFVPVICLNLSTPKNAEIVTESRIQPPEKLADYLYYLELEDYSFDAMPKKDSPFFTTGCSSVRKGDLYGRNLDLSYCDIPEFIVRVDASRNRFASIGICADLTISGSEDDISKKQLRAMPNVTNDGINENGVVVSVNVVDATGMDDMSGTAPGKDKLHSSRVVRYLLDRAESARHAIELMKDVDIVGGFSGYALHWMIADENDTFVVEIIDGELVVSENEQFYMTNFYLNYGPALTGQYIAGIVFEKIPLLNDYAIGVERWCILRDGYDAVATEQDMVNLLASVRGTAMYSRDNNPLWYSEVSGGTISIHSDKADLDNELNRQIGLFENRDRTNPQGDWITWHTAVYDIPSRSLCVYSQEDYSVDYRFELAE